MLIIYALLVLLLVLGVGRMLGRYRIHPAPHGSMSERWLAEHLASSPP